MRTNVLWERKSILNQVAEYLLLSVENKQETKLNFSKLNITEKIDIDVVEKELNKLGIQIQLESDRYEKMVFKMDKFINQLNKEKFVYQKSRDI